MNKSGKPVTLYPYGLISRHGTPKTAGYYILHEGLIGYLGDKALQEYTYKKIEDKKAGRLRRHQRLARHHRQVLGRGPAARPEGAPEGALLDRQARHAERPIRPTICSTRSTVAPGASASVDTHLFAGAKEVQRPQRLREPVQPQPLRSADRLGLVLLHHQADVHGDRLVLPAGRQFRHRHPDRHRADQGRLLPARQQVLRLDGEDEGGAAADGRAEGALSPTTRPSSSRS